MAREREKSTAAGLISRAAAGVPTIAIILRSRARLVNYRPLWRYIYIPRPGYRALLSLYLSSVFHPCIAATVHPDNKIFLVDEGGRVGGRVATRPSTEILIKLELVYINFSPSWTNYRFNDDVVNRFNWN